MRADYEELGLGKYEPAYVSYHHGEHPEYKTPLTVIVFWDCVGDPMLISEVHQSSSVFADWCGVGWAYPDYWCRGMNDHRGTDGMFEDVRSLWMIIMGCCPIELSNEILGADGGPD